MSTVIDGAEVVPWHSIGKGQYWVRYGLHVRYFASVNGGQSGCHRSAGQNTVPDWQIDAEVERSPE